MKPTNLPDPADRYDDQRTNRHQVQSAQFLLLHRRSLILLGVQYRD